MYISNASHDISLQPIVDIDMYANKVYVFDWFWQVAKDTLWID